MLSDFDVTAVTGALGYLFRDGLRFTLTLSAAGGAVLGSASALMRLSALRWLSAMARPYVTLLRALPLVLVIFWVYFLVPYLGAWLTGAERPVHVGAFLSSRVAFTLFEAAYFSEIMRAGIQSVPQGHAAGRALGLGDRQVTGPVVLPQAVRRMTPVLLTRTIVLFQDTSLVYVLSITDFLGAATKIAQRDGRLAELCLFAAAVYFALSWLGSAGLRRLGALS
ncbi:amino acid ABC transporter permease [Poseidonocella sp. HB161398]|uniref:amino acid ABC transporter permease n=1 Tax=Poseidonocella sp. HB161398 TaxID=2320855 RepID=UPI001109B429|nr:ABC transporter permease subunit [Poseidonocella sp. HB161398]